MDKIYSKREIGEKNIQRRQFLSYSSWKGKWMKKSEITKKRMHSICVGDFGVVGNSLYLSNGVFNALIKLDMQTNRITFIDDFPDFELDRYALHRICKVVGETVCFFQETGNIINFYNSLNNSHYSINIDYGMQSGYPCGVQYVYGEGEEKYLFPAYVNNGLIKLDVRDKKYAFEDWWHIRNDATDDVIIRSGYFDSGKVWSQSTVSNNIYISDIPQNHVDEWEVNLDGKRMHICDYDGQSFWMDVRNDSSIYKWNPSEGIQNVITPNVEMGDDGYCYKAISSYGGRVFVFLRHKNTEEIYVIDETCNTLRSLGGFPDWVVYPNVPWTVYSKQYKRKVYFFCYYTNLVIEVDIDSLNTRFISTTVNDDMNFDKYIDNMIEKYQKDIIIERNSYDFRTSLTAFLDIVTDEYK